MHPTIKMSSRTMEQSISHVKRQAQQLAPEDQEEEEEPAFEGTRHFQLIYLIF